MKRIGKVFLILIICLLTLTSCANYSSTSYNNSSSGTITVSNEVISMFNNSATQAPSTVEEAVDAVYDSVVVINAFTTTGYGSGSGVVIGESDTASYIVTCHHVIEDMDSYQVILSNGSSYEGILVGGDPATDIAVLRIAVTGLNPVSFITDSSKIRLGSTAIAIGNPLGILANTVTVGVVSAVNREINFSDGTKEVLLQTDAAINSGNSGGGLFNVSGELIGIVSSKYSSSGVEGLGFAVPANTVREICTELLSHGYVTGRYDLGITIGEGYTGGGFFSMGTLVVYVKAVDRNGSAYGLLQTNDIITKIETVYKDLTKTNVSKTISELEDATDILQSGFEIGDKLIFTVTRSGSSKTVEVEIKQYIYK